MIAAASTPQVAAGTAVILGLLVAVWARWRLEASDPAGWAWPMAVALACAPVVYPWYLLSFTPFLLHQRHVAAAGVDLQRDSRVSGLGVLPSRGPLGRAGGVDGRGIWSAVADARGEGDPAPRHEPVAKNREPDAYSSGITTQRMM